MSARSGWAYGDVGTGAGGWLTILGSAHTSPVLHPTREAAQAALEESRQSKAAHLVMAVAHVTEVRHPGVYPGYAYRVTPGTLVMHVREPG